MKINERVSQPGDDSIAGGSCGIDPETLNQLKAEFHDFVLGTRRRLSSVADHLRELDRERTRLETQASCDLTTQVDETQAPNEQAANVTPQEEDGITGDSIDPSEADAIWDSTGSSHEVEAAPTVESKLISVQVKSAEEPQTLTQVPNTPDRQSTDRFEPAARTEHQAVFPPADGNRSATGPIDTDSDPLERLNAIKARLAKQIEKA